MFEQAKEQMEQVLAHFEEEAWDLFFGEHDYIEKIIFFGSFVKGLQNEQSDIDLICIPKEGYLNQLDGGDRLGVLFALHEDLTGYLVKDIPLDVKIQEGMVEEDQFGLSYHTADLVAIDYAFAKGQIGTCAMMTPDFQLEYRSL